MPVPSYDPILDSEIDPESPITSSLMFRLRDNWMAVLGIDNTDPSPEFTIPPSVATAEAAPTFYAHSTSASTITSSEMIVSVVLDDIEFITLGQSAAIPYDGGGTISAPTFVVPHLLSGPVWMNAGSASHNFPFNLSLIDVLYASGAPTGVRIVGRSVVPYSTGASILGSYSADVTIALTNTWQTIYNQSGIEYYTCTIQAKARADATNVYLQFRITNLGGAPAHIEIPFTRRSFKSKAAP